MAPEELNPYQSSIEQPIVAEIVRKPRPWYYAHPLLWIVGAPAMWIVAVIVWVLMN